mgnify:CR=1 FL=1
MKQDDIISLREDIQDLARITANGFAEMRATMATKDELKEELRPIRKDIEALKEEVQYIHKELRPLRRDYGALKDDLTLQVISHEHRIGVLEKRS